MCDVWIKCISFMRNNPPMSVSVDRDYVDLLIPLFSCELAYPIYLLKLNLVKTHQRHIYI